MWKLDENHSGAVMLKLSKRYRRPALKDRI